MQVRLLLRAQKEKCPEGAFLFLFLKYAEKLLPELRRPKGGGNTFGQHLRLLLRAQKEKCPEIELLTGIYYNTSKGRLYNSKINLKIIWFFQLFRV